MEIGSPPDQSRLLSIPYELRLEIYKYLVPYHETINFHLKPGLKRNRGATEKERAFEKVNGTEFLRLKFLCLKGLLHRTTTLQSKPHPLPSTGLASSAFFSINKQIADEIADVLYSSNTFNFVIDISLQTIFLYRRDRYRMRSRSNKPLHMNHFPEVIWNMTDLFGRRVKKIKIEISSLCWDDLRLYKAAKEWFALLTTAISGRNGRHLELLDIQYVNKNRDWHYQLYRGGFFSSAPQKITPFLMEPLATLRPLEVSIKGMPQENWFLEFCKKLERIVKGEISGGLKELSYGNTIYRAKTSRGKRRKITKSSKVYYKPTYDWSAAEFSQNDEDEAGRDQDNADVMMRDH